MRPRDEADLPRACVTGLHKPGIVILSRMRGVRLVFFLSVLMLCLVSGCGSTAQRHPPSLSRATDPTLRASARIDSIERIAPDQVFELFSLVASSLHPIEVRRAAVDRMLGLDAGRFWQLAEQRSAQIDDWPMIQLLSERAETEQEPRAAAWLVRSWAEPSRLVTDEDRPERQALRSVTGESAEDALWMVAFQAPPYEQLKWLVGDGPGDGHSLSTRAAAWSVLTRLKTAEQLAADLLHVNGPDNLFLVTLQRCAMVLQQLPSNREEIARMFVLSRSVSASQWEAWAAWRTEHHNDGPANLALRHLPILSTISDQQARWTRAQWLESVGQRLAGRRHVNRGKAAGDQVVTARPERLSDHADSLGCGDLIVLDALLNLLEDREAVADLFRQAETDRSDTTTEHGGALVQTGRDGWTPRSFTPLIKLHDQVYYASDACVRAMHTGLAHYHFHTQKHDNAAWAGPGKGDLDFADRMHANCVVFTFIDANTLNVDAYFPGGVIVDLGCITR